MAFPRSSLRIRDRSSTAGAEIAGLSQADVGAPAAVPADYRALLHIAVIACLVASLVPLSYPVVGVFVHSIDAPLALLAVLAMLSPHHPPVARSPDRLGSAIDAGLALYVWLFALSAIYSVHPLNSLNATLDLARCAVGYLALRRVLATGVLRLRFLLWAVLACWTIEIAVGVAQHATEQPIGMVSTYFGDTSGSEVGWFEFDEEVSYDKVIRVSGTHYLAPDYGCWLVFFSMVLTAGIALLRVPAAARALLLGVLHGLTLWLLTLSLARGVVAFYLLALGLLFALWQARRPARLLLPLCAAALLMLLLTTALLTPDLHDLTSQDVLLKRSFEDEQRGLFLDVALHLMDFPRTWLIGVGPDAIFPAASRFGVDLTHLAVYGTTDFHQHSSGTHNFFVDTAVESGCMAAITVILTMLASTTKAWRDYLGAHHRRERVIAAVLAAFWSAAYIPFLTQNNYLAPFGGLFVVFMLAWLQEHRRAAVSFPRLETALDG